MSDATPTFKYRHYINLGVCITYFDAPTRYCTPLFCGKHDHYSRPKARELGKARWFKAGIPDLVIWDTRLDTVLTMLDRATPRDHNSHQWIRHFVCELLGVKNLPPSEIPF